MSEQLPDSGGAYMDRDSESVTGVARRIATSAKREVMSGDVGGEAAKYAIGGALATGIVWVWNSTVGDGEN